MNSAKIFLIFLLLNFVIQIASSDDDENCRWIYRCCKKVGGACVEVCEPEIICDDVETTTEFFEPKIFPSAVFHVDCKAGFRQNHHGKCKKII